MKIILFGGSGMIGRNLISYNSIHTIISPTSKDVNLLDYEKLNEFIKLHKPDLIINSAGLVGGIQHNINMPFEFFSKNIQMGLNLVNASKNNFVKKLINLGSSSVYPKNISGKISEDMLLTGPLEPTNEGYALAKIAIIKMCEYLSLVNKEFSYKTIIPCNLFGLYDKFDSVNSHMIPSVIMKIHKAHQNSEKTVEIWGDGTAKREFMFAQDLCDFILYCIENYDRMPQNINFGRGKDYTINEYYEIISKIIGFKGEFIHNTNKPVGMKKKLTDIQLMKDFGWNNITSLETGISKSYNYYKNQTRNE